MRLFLERPFRPQRSRLSTCTTRVFFHAIIFFSVIVLHTLITLKLLSGGSRTHVTAGSGVRPALSLRTVCSGPFGRLAVPCGKAGREGPGTQASLRCAMPSSSCQESGGSVFAAAGGARSFQRHSRPGPWFCPQCCLWASLCTLPSGALQRFGLQPTVSAPAARKPGGVPRRGSQGGVSDSPPPNARMHACTHTRTPNRSPRASPPRTRYAWPPAMCQNHRCSVPTRLGPRHLPPSTQASG